MFHLPMHERLTRKRLEAAYQDEQRNWVGTAFCTKCGKRHTLADKPDFPGATEFSCSGCYTENVFSVATLLAYLDWDFLRRERWPDAEHESTVSYYFVPAGPIVAIWQEETFRHWVARNR